MEINIYRYTDEVLEFMNSDTLYEIDCGILDLSHVRDMELKNIYCYLEELLSVELELNYRQNATGIFRVYLFGDIWCYFEGECVISAYSESELKRKVTSQRRIWYVFDGRPFKKY